MLSSAPQQEEAMQARNLTGHRLATLATLTLFAAACSSAGSYVWVNDVRLPPPSSSAEYTIASGDVLAIRVLGHDELSDPKVRVRDDGRIALPIVGEVNARGTKPSELRGALETRFKDYLKEPTITVNLEEGRPAEVSILGEVSHPGTYPIAPGFGVAQLLAGAGGVTEFANRDRIFVVRGGGPQPLRVRFTYEALTHGDPAASGFALRAGDVVVVE
jgi:polysaccharide export outer membrane protein